MKSPLLGGVSLAIGFPFLDRHLRTKAACATVSDWRKNLHGQVVTVSREAHSLVGSATMRSPSRISAWLRGLPVGIEIDVAVYTDFSGLKQSTPPNEETLIVEQLADPSVAKTFAFHFSNDSSSWNVMYYFAKILKNALPTEETELYVWNYGMVQVNDFLEVIRRLPFRANTTLYVSCYPDKKNSGDMVTVIMHASSLDRHPAVVSSIAGLGVPLSIHRWLLGDDFSRDLYNAFRTSCRRIIRDQRATRTND